MKNNFGMKLHQEYFEMLETVDCDARHNVLEL